MDFRVPSTGDGSSSLPRLIDSVCQLLGGRIDERFPARMFATFDWERMQEPSVEGKVYAALAKVESRHGVRVMQQQLEVSEHFESAGRPQSASRLPPTDAFVAKWWNARHRGDLNVARVRTGQESVPKHVRARFDGEFRQRRRILRITWCGGTLYEAADSDVDGAWSATALETARRRVEATFAAGDGVRLVAVPVAMRCELYAHQCVLLLSPTEGCALMDPNGYDWAHVGFWDGWHLTHYLHETLARMPGLVHSLPPYDPYVRHVWCWPRGFAIVLGNRDHWVDLQGQASDNPLFARAPRAHRSVFHNENDGICASVALLFQCALLCYGGDALQRPWWNAAYRHVTAVGTGIPKGRLSKVRAALVVMQLRAFATLLYDATAAPASARRVYVWFDRVATLRNARDARVADAEILAFKPDAFVDGRLAFLDAQPGITQRRHRKRSPAEP